MARKILLADDSVTAQNMGRKILADAGYEVITVNNGSAALKKIAEQKPDLIVLDVYMPGYSGLEVCQRLKEAHETARIPILLTVGKLEPFKPEEAKRVRAEAFIVKPFEASELLSILAKLEDKIVPRGESSKPGRFARALAAVEETTGDDAADEKTGWKNRIAFPSKKKKPEREMEDGNDPAIYNPRNQDMRTVVDHEPARKKKEKDQELEVKPDRIDVGALGTPGVPRDVSGEEIAAIAAAAAQVQAAGDAAREPMEVPRSDRTERDSFAPAVSVEADTFAETNTAKIESRQDQHSAEIRKEDRGEEPTEDHSENTRTAPANAEMIAAMAALEPTNGHSWSTGSPASAGHSTGETPVTMAVAAGAEDGAAPRWMAIPVAVDPDEAAISLEHEMQKAYAAFAAAEANSPGFVSSGFVNSGFVNSGSVNSGFVTSIPDPVAPTEAVAPAPEITAQTPAPTTEPEPQAPSLEPELAQSVNAVASASADALGGAVTELAAVAATHVDASTQALGEGPAEVEQKSTASSQEATSDSPASGDGGLGPGQQIATPPEQAEEPSHIAEQAVEPAPSEVVEQPVVSETPGAEPVLAEATATPGESAVGGMRDMAEKTESDMAASTAAAWASWRQIRETAQHHQDGGSPSEREFADESSAHADSAAMAVAAGAEKAPEGASAADGDDPAAIASIVDSVLADLRPKIVEEISRKLGKRKK